MKKLNKYAKENRRYPTRAELEFKKMLQRWGIKFRSQKPFDYYIVDFLIFERRLIIEVDGGYHSSQVDKDLKRQAYLEGLGLGLKILRVTNEEVINTDCEALRREILSYPVVPHYEDGKPFWRRKHLTK